MGQNASRAWAGSIAVQIGKNIQRARKLAAMSALQLSTACEVSGYPIPRSTIANIESGRKETVSLQELMIIAHALNTPALTLIQYPYDAAKEARLTPNSEPVLSIDAAALFAFSDLRSSESELGALQQQLFNLRGQEESALALIRRAESVQAGGAHTYSAHRGSLSTEALADLAKQETDSINKSVLTIIKEASRNRAALTKAAVDLWSIPPELESVYVQVAREGQAE